MATYKLINESTHKIFYTDNEKEKNQLLERGFHIQNSNVDETKNPTTKKRKAVSKNERKPKNQNRPKGDI